jgi:hypothetical protein
MMHYSQANRNTWQPFKRSRAQESLKSRYTRYISYCETHGVGSAVRTFTVCQTTCDGCLARTRCPFYPSEASHE